MKAVLEFNLPEDDQEFALASEGSHLSIVLWDLDQDLRRLEKDGDEEDPSIKISRVRELIRDHLLAWGLTFDHKIFQ